MHNLAANQIPNTLYGLNCFGHVIYSTQTCIYQIIAEMFIHSRNM